MLASNGMWLAFLVERRRAYCLKRELSRPLAANEGRRSGEPAHPDVQVGVRAEVILTRVLYCNDCRPTQSSSSSLASSTTNHELFFSLNKCFRVRPGCADSLCALRTAIS
jgi:hypothetical protein